MTRQPRYFILAEAAKLVPLVRRILHDIREARAQLSKLDRMLERVDWTDEEEISLRQRRSDVVERLQECLAEASQLGVEITPGIRCVALFPFEHRWIGPKGDGRIRPAYFVFDDAHPTITQWYFSGWPNDRRKVNEKWWKVRRPSRPSGNSEAVAT